MNKRPTNLPVSNVIRASVQIAQVHRSLYEAYCEQGFTPDQAMALLAVHITTHAPNYRPGTQNDEG